MDQPICGHLDDHRPVARGDHVHAPEDDPAHNQDHPQVRHVPAGADPEPAADSHHQHLGSQWNHRLHSALLGRSQRIHDESAAFDPGDVHYHAGNTPVVPPPVRPTSRRTR